MTNAPLIDGTPDLDLSGLSSSSSQIVAEAIAVIDRALSQMVKRELVSTAEVSDLLLDVRNLLSSASKSQA
jgi:galactokinase